MTDAVKTPDRRARAAQTRHRILVATRDLILERGLADTSMGRVAARAGVAVQTVHFVFHTKEELLQAVIDACVLGTLSPEDVAEDPEQSRWWHESQATADPDRAISIFVSGCLEVVERAAGVVVAAQQAAKSSESLTRLMQEGEDRRLQAYRTFAQSLADRGFLRPDVDVDRATDVLGALAGEECYLAFTLTRGWSRSAYEQWLVSELPRLLFRDAR